MATEILSIGSDPSTSIQAISSQWAMVKAATVVAAGAVAGGASLGKTKAVEKILTRLSRLAHYALSTRMVS
jgi:hypothetical protein